MPTLTAAPLTGDDNGVIMTPNGTVTLTTEPGGFLISSEAEPDPTDWDMACDHIAQTGGRITAAWAEGPADLMRVTLPS
jgi:hypothetical protein